MKIRRALRPSDRFTFQFALLMEQAQPQGAFATALFLKMARPGFQQIIERYQAPKCSSGTGLQSESACMLFRHTIDNDSQRFIWIGLDRARMNQIANRFR